MDHLPVEVLVDWENGAMVGGGAGAVAGETTCGVGAGVDEMLGAGCAGAGTKATLQATTMLRSFVDALEPAKLCALPPTVVIDTGSSEGSSMSYPALLQMSPAAE